MQKLYFKKDFKSKKIANQCNHLQNSVPGHLTDFENRCSPTLLLLLMLMMIPSDETFLIFEMSIHFESLVLEFEHNQIILLHFDKIR